MRLQFFKFFLLIILTNTCISAYSQEKINNQTFTYNILDSLKKSGVRFSYDQKIPEISLSKYQALKFLKENLHPDKWKNSNDPLRQALTRLIYESSHSPVDSLKNELNKYPYDSLNIHWEKFYIWEPLKLRIPVIPKMEFHSSSDSTIKADSNLINGVKVSSVTELKDTTIMVIIDTLNNVASPFSGSPFKYFSHPFQADSLKSAVRLLLNYLDERDSVLINLTGVGKTVTPIILNSKSEKIMRFWLKNEFSDSVTIWIGNQGRNTIGLYPEQGVNFRRTARQSNYAKAKINLDAIDKTKLQELQNIALNPQYWKYRTESAFFLTQAALSNWVKGGENSISTALDITGYADYNNKKLKISSNNFARIKFGYLKSGKEKLQKNIDLLETNSKLNHKAFGKFDFSAILLFKTQVAKGRNYFKTSSGKDTSNVVSKFMNPAVLTIGIGLDFKPNKTTSINLSPLSYKGTFVTDPAYMNNRYDSTKIDQTQYGVPKNRKSLNEPGVSFMITNEFKPIETVTIINRLQLFTNYIHNPQNVDVDWEMIATAKLNWFTDVRLNTHLIFDDDTKTDKLVDGVIKKTARIQFKEVLGFSLFFRF